MLTEALVALAGTGATALVSAIATDSWQAVKTGFARLLGRGDERRERSTEQLLDRAEAELRAAGSQRDRVQVKLEAAWGARLEDLLAEDPGTAQQLRVLVDQAKAASRGIGVANQNVVGFGNAQQAVQGQGMQANTFGQSARDGVRDAG